MRSRIARVLDEVGPQLTLGGPQGRRRDLVDDVPHARVVGVGVGTVLRGQLEDSAAHPRRGVHAVGDRGDRHVRLVERRPQAVEHPAADLTVQERDAVGALGQAEAHHGHVEHAAVAAVVVLGTEPEDPVDRYAADRALRAEVLLHQLAREAVDAGRDRGVRGEHGAGAGDLERSVEVEVGAVVGQGQLADPLEPEEPGVALVGVEHLRLHVAGQAAVGAHGPDAADAEEQLLEEPVLGGAAVEPVGHLAQRRRVVLHVGVEQQQRHAPDLGDEDLRDQLVVAGHGDPHLRGAAVLLAQQRDRQPVGVEHRVGLLLPSLAGQLLAEVAHAVEQADADQRVRRGRSPSSGGHRRGCPDRRSTAAAPR